MGIEAAGDGLKTVLAGLGVRTFAPKELEDRIPELPCILILPGEINYDTTFNTHYDLTLRLLLLLAQQDKPSAFNALLDYIEETGTSSIVAKVKADRTLNGSVNDCKVLRNLGIGATVWGGIAYLSTEFEIAVML